ncbi:Cutinase transcription factor 1 alpha [Yarrowia sp. B02]|nr:Cutinase transcription factor 1 alpha [Yarrowia sp. B02]
MSSKVKEEEGATPGGGGAGNAKFGYRRAKPRASRACEVCHARKVRCDVTERMPCTNCQAFGCECKIPEVKRKKNDKKAAEKVAQKDAKDRKRRKTDGEDSDEGSVPPQGAPSNASSSTASSPNTAPTAQQRLMHFQQETKQQQYQQHEGEAKPDANPNLSDSSNTWLKMLDSKVVKQSGRVAFLGSSSNLNLLLDANPDNEAYHYPLPAEITGGNPVFHELDPEEIEILKLRGAFLLPPRELCDDIVESYFEKIHPVIPIVNRTQFMRRYNDPVNTPSLLLLQAVLLAGSRVCRNPALLDANGSSDQASLTFYKRAKALYDSNYENDRISIVQSLALMGWWWEGPEDVTKNVFYWSRVGLCVAQGFGLHRSVENSSLSVAEKRMWKRVWWVIFFRDRAIAVSLGRPVMINLEDSDVPMLTEDDFIEDEPDYPSPYPVNRLHSLYFIHAVKLSEIMGLVLRQQFSVGAEHSHRLNRIPVLKYSVKDMGSHNFYKALLHSQYYTILCLVHRSNILQRRTSEANESAYPSWGIAFQAAHMIAKIMENMLAYNELRDTPAFMVYTLFSAMIMLVYQTESKSPSVVESANRSLDVCMKALEECGKTWVVARMVLKLFKHMNESQPIRNHMAKTIRRHARGVSKTDPPQQKMPQAQHQAPPQHQAPQHHAQHQQQQQPPQQQQQHVRPQQQQQQQHTQPHAPQPERKFNNHPFEQQQQQQPQEGEEYLGERPATNPGTPFNGTLPSKPGTPHPDFYFVTNTPPASNTFFESFQPMQLFPDVTGDMSNLQSQLQEPAASALPPDMFGHADGASHTEGGTYKSSPEDEPNAASGFGYAPQSLNIGDWYQYLMMNGEGGGAGAAASAPPGAPGSVPPGAPAEAHPEAQASNAWNESH